MKCRRARKLIFACLDGAADESVRLDLEQHLTACEACEHLATDLARSMDVLHRAPSEKLDENFNWKVRLAIHKERNATNVGIGSWRETFRAWNLRYAVSAAAAFAVVVAAGWMVFDLSPAAIGNGIAAHRQAALHTETVAQQQQQTPLRPVSGSAFTGNSQSELVSLGGGPTQPVSKQPGAISASPAVVDMDSLVWSQLSTMTREQGIRFLQDNIRRFQDHLQKYQEGPQSQ